MEKHDPTPALTVSLAMAAGMVAQSLAAHLRLPGIVLLLAAGVLLGPDVFDVVRPATLGDGLQLIVGFAVAVILFEGGMNLGLRRLRRQARVIQLLISVGALITATGGALAGRFILGWEWNVAVPFGALVVVTGPTVITPLLRRIKVTHRVETVLEAEGVLIDAIGAVLAVITLEVVLRNPSSETIADGALDILQHLGFGLLCGLVGGFLIAAILRVRRIVPDGYENVFTLSLVLVLFQASNWLMPESGIMAVTAAGIVVGNVRTRVRDELREFKEQLTVMLIGMLFVLLAADVRLDRVLSLGRPGLWALLFLMIVVRPVNIFVSTIGSRLSMREKLFLSWMAPRGVVAAAVASLFAQSFASAGIEGGEDLQAMVFVVIAGTVLIQGLSGGAVARLLGLRRPVNRGFVIAGANAVGRALAAALREGQHEVLLVDSDPEACRAAEEQGLRVIYGNPLEDRTLQRAQLEDRLGCIAVTPMEEANLMLSRAATQDFHLSRVYVGCRKDSMSVTPSLVRAAEAMVLFGRSRDLELWMVRLRRGITTTERWQLAAAPPEKGMFEAWDILLLPLVLTRGSKTEPLSDRTALREGDEVTFVVFNERAAEARSVLESQGFAAL